MDSQRYRWLTAAMFGGVLYFIAAVLTAALAGAATSQQMQFFWRLCAFVISGVVFVAHLVYERIRLRNTVRAAAWHTSLAVAFGAFALSIYKS